MRGKGEHSDFFKAGVMARFLRIIQYVNGAIAFLAISLVFRGLVPLWRLTKRYLAGESAG